MIEIRQIQEQDNTALANIIRTSLIEYTTDLEGTVYTDPTTDDLYNLFRKERSVYNVALENDVILGGGGLYPGEGMDDDTVELVKMYLSKDARGKKIGYKLLDLSIQQAREFGYKKVYLETLPILKSAIHLYEKYGFNIIDAPIGNTGHHGCDMFMLLEI